MRIAQLVLLLALLWAASSRADVLHPLCKAGVPRAVHGGDGPTTCGVALQQTGSVLYAYATQQLSAVQVSVFSDGLLLPGESIALQLPRGRLQRLPCAPGQPSVLHASPALQAGEQLRWRLPPRTQITTVQVVAAAHGQLLPGCHVHVPLSALSGSDGSAPVAGDGSGSGSEGMVAVDSGGSGSGNDTAVEGEGGNAVADGSGDAAGGQTGLVIALEVIGVVAFLVAVGVYYIYSRSAQKDAASGDGKGEGSELTEMARKGSGGSEAVVVLNPLGGDEEAKSSFKWLTSSMPSPAVAAVSSSSSSSRRSGSGSGASSSLSSSIARGGLATGDDGVASIAAGDGDYYDSSIAAGSSFASSLRSSPPAHKRSQSSGRIAELIDKRTSVALGVALPSGALPSLPPGWAAAVDKATAAVYYYNATTQETSWSRPTA